MSGYPKAVASGWHPVATVRELRGRPLARRLMDTPLVVFRGREGPVVFIDRCPHRNAPLSAGRLRGGEIECRYHGWRFSGDGRCTLVPGAVTPSSHRAERLPAVECAGLVWTSLAEAPRAFQPLPHPLEAEGFDSFLWPVKPARAALVDAIENLLDPAHPHFLHAGIVRSGRKRHPVDVTVRIDSTRAEAIYLENARPEALMPRLLEGLRATSVGRFFPPATAQLAFEGPDGPRLAITVFFSPEGPFSVRPFAHLATPMGRAPALLKELVLRAFNAPVLAQDRAVLRQQADNVERFGAARYALGPLDFLRPAIQALADGKPLEPSERTTRVSL